MSKFTLQKISTEKFEQFYRILEEDFCFLERKKYQNELDAFQNPNFLPAYICVDQNPVGYICYWEFEDFIYIEHFAIMKSLRDQGVGSKFLEEFLKNISKLVILEAERPTDCISEKRIRFYERMGFAINQYDYYQPSYHQGEKEVPMFICTYPRSISEEEYFDLTKQIKNVVYLNMA